MQNQAHQKKITAALAKQPLSMTMAQTAKMLAISYGVFCGAINDMISDEGFPPPFIGASGRHGIRRRWYRRAVEDWMQAKSTVKHIQFSTVGNDMGIDLTNQFDTYLGDHTIITRHIDRLAKS